MEKFGAANNGYLAIVLPFGIVVGLIKFFKLGGGKNLCHFNLYTKPETALSQRRENMQLKLRACF
jgi:hypothetical protein